MKLSPFVALALVCASPSTAKEDYHIIGTGVMTCGTWTSEKSNELAHVANFMWVQGFLTAFNRFGPETPVGNITEGFSADDLSLWIDNYCAAHPLDKLDDAAGKLLLDLTSRKIANRQSKK